MSAKNKINRAPGSDKTPEPPPEGAKPFSGRPNERLVSQLEQALLSQAESLAAEQLRGAETARARILAEAEGRLRLKSEREVLAAKGEAERRVRRQLQAAETRLAAELDRVRWALTESVLSQVRQSLRALSQDSERYLEVLYEYLAAAARQLPAGELVAEVRPEDHELLLPVWVEFARRAAPERKVELATHAQPSLGGMRVRTQDNRARLDQTFEARLERLGDELPRRVMEQLYASAPDLGTLVHGA